MPRSNEFRTALAGIGLGFLALTGAAPDAAADRPSNPITRDQLKKACDAIGGQWIDLQVIYQCLRPDGSGVTCTYDGNCWESPPDAPSNAPSTTVPGAPGTGTVSEPRTGGPAHTLPRRTLPLERRR